MVNRISLILNDSKQKEYFFFLTCWFQYHPFFWHSFGRWALKQNLFPDDTHLHTIQKQREEMGIRSPPTLFPLVGRAMKKAQTGICTNGFIQNLQLFTWCSISTDTFWLVDDFSFCCLSSQLHSTIFFCLKMRQGKFTRYSDGYQSLFFHLVHVRVLAWFWSIHLI